MASKPPVLIITGYGVNCEAESKVAWEMAGADTRLIHLHDLLAKPEQLRSFKALMFIGGFSFDDPGDERDIKKRQDGARPNADLIKNIHRS